VLNLPRNNCRGPRHHHATAFLRNGEPLHLIAQQEGHYNVMLAVMLYEYLYDEQAENAAATFSNSFHRGA